MATESEIYQLVIDPMEAVFSKPYRKSDDEIRRAKAQYIAALKDFSAETLQKTWVDVRGAWNKAAWPSIGYIRERADRIAGQARGRAKAEKDRSGKIAWPVAVRWLWETDNGRLAVERDVCEAFCYEAVRLQRIPARQEVLAMTVDSGTITEAELQALERRGALSQAAAQFGRAIRDNNARLREKAKAQMFAMGDAPARSDSETDDWLT